MFDYLYNEIICVIGREFVVLLSPSHLELIIQSVVVLSVSLGVMHVNQTLDIHKGYFLFPTDVQEKIFMVLLFLRVI